MLAFRDAVIKELKERFGVPAVAQAPPKFDSASAGMVENAIKQVKEKVRTLVIATRELHGVVMDPERCVRFARQIISRTVKGTDGLTAFHSAFQRASHPRSMPAACGEKILYLEASKNKVQISDKFENYIFLAIKNCSEEFIVGTLAGCVVCRTVKRRPRDDAADPVFFNSIRGILRRLLPDVVVREPRGRPSRIDVRPVQTDLPPPINEEPIKPRRGTSGIQSS